MGILTSQATQVGGVRTGSGPQKGGAGHHDILLDIFNKYLECGKKDLNI